MFWQARGRGGKEAREEENQVQTNRQELTVGLGKEKLREENSLFRTPEGFFCR